MKAVTLHRPWAQAIADWSKRVENRNWKPRLQQGEWFAIHAGKRFDSVGANWIANIEGAQISEPSCATGIVAIAQYGGILTWEQASLSDNKWLGDADYCWMLSQVITLDEAISCPGKQGLWSVPSEIAGRLSLLIPEGEA